MFQETAKADPETKLRIAVNKMRIGFSQKSLLILVALRINKGPTGRTIHAHPSVAKENEAM